MTIEEIKSNLTNDKDKNVAYLRSLLEEHSKDNEVYQAIRELILQNLDEQTIKKYSAEMKDPRLFCEAKFDDIHKYIKNFQYDKAEKITFEIIDFMNVYLKTVDRKSVV